MPLNDLRKNQVSGFYLDVPVTPGEGKAGALLLKKYSELTEWCRLNIDYDCTLLECHVDLDLEGFEEVDSEGEMLPESRFLMLLR